MAALRFPNGAKFAFTVFDDTDEGTVENLRPVYELLHELGFKTTKSVWPLAPKRPTKIAGQTLADPAYLAFIRQLQGWGFEIALHNATMHAVERPEIEQALQQFHQLIGQFPKVHCNHYNNEDNLYWGEERLNPGLIRLFYTLARLGKGRPRFQGHRPESPYYWGDLAQRHIKYARNFVFDEINTLKINQTLPYKDLRRPLIPYWFSSANGGDLAAWCRTLSLENQERLATEGGVCIMYTHFAYGFVDQAGRLDPTFEAQLRALAQRGGWYVPVSTLLDYLIEQGVGGRAISAAEYASLQRRWFFSKLKSGTS